MNPSPNFSNYQIMLVLFHLYPHPLPPLLNYWQQIPHIFHHASLKGKGFPKKITTILLPYLKNLELLLDIKQLISVQISLTHTYTFNLFELGSEHGPCILQSVICVCVNIFTLFISPPPSLFSCNLLLKKPQSLSCRVSHTWIASL